MISVTECLPFNADDIPEAVLANAAERGKLVHQAIHLIETVELNWDHLDPVLRPYCRAWLKFKKETGWITDEGFSEYEVINEKHNFIGHPDKRGIFTKLKKIFNRKRTVLEIKCVAQVSPTTALQLAAYTGGAPSQRRACVQLKPDETYTLQFYEKRSDWFDFLAHLRVKRWAYDNGIETPKEKAA